MWSLMPMLGPQPVHLHLKVLKLTKARVACHELSYNRLFGHTKGNTWLFLPHPNHLGLGYTVTTTHKDKGNTESLTLQQGTHANLESMEIVNKSAQKARPATIKLPVYMVFTPWTTKVVPRSCKICDWLLNLSQNDFSLHQGKSC